ncbi:ArpU family phage packaging/lysis transcriptional regulator [Enterococcus gallinarum]|uniref:ArpU family phage packaging/lysis transcriptional regulator n=1 Tax=Enterococcus TaxID=1350 RepID=UPI00100E09E6|nr:ArpU family phage packaging/lysis transcriptional regulator [Enterococcus faecalis]RXV98698.1 autolysin [Enterococcus faecalis]
MKDVIKEVDFKQTRANARNVLKNFRRLERIAGRSAINLKSPIISDMPRTPTNGNKTENATIQKVDAEVERDAIEAALKALSLISRQILYYSFCDVEKHSNYEIGQLISGYGEKNVEKLKSIALIEFAEAYKKGSLIQYR